MNTVLVANPKGGSGKTTLAVNLAAMLSAQGDNVRLLDLDRQQSAAQWLAQRPVHLPTIWPFEPGKATGTQTGWLIIDSPAGLHGKTLERALKLACHVLVPIVPSAFDMTASQHFLRSLQQEKAVRKQRSFVGMVGMRVTPRTRAAQQLETWLNEQDLPLLTLLQDTQNYVNACFEGKAIFDLPLRTTVRERAQWQGLADWLTPQTTSHVRAMEKK